MCNNANSFYVPRDHSLQLLLLALVQLHVHQLREVNLLFLGRRRVLAVPRLHGLDGRQLLTASERRRGLAARDLGEEGGG